eukprot:1159553-Pelagomonas_calceolata.AAC.19
MAEHAHLHGQAFCLQAQRNPQKVNDAHHSRPFFKTKVSACSRHSMNQDECINPQRLQADAIKDVHANKCRTLAALCRCGYVGGPCIGLPQAMPSIPLPARSYNHIHRNTVTPSNSCVWTGSLSPGYKDYKGSNTGTPSNPCVWIGSLSPGYKDYKGRSTGTPSTSCAWTGSLSSGYRGYKGLAYSPKLRLIGCWRPLSYPRRLQPHPRHPPSPPKQHRQCSAAGSWPCASRMWRGGCKRPPMYVPAVRV